MKKSAAAYRHRNVQSRVPFHKGARTRTKACPFLPSQGIRFTLRLPHQDDNLCFLQSSSMALTSHVREGLSWAAAVGRQASLE